MRGAGFAMMVESLYLPGEGEMTLRTVPASSASRFSGAPRRKGSKDRKVGDFRHKGTFTPSHPNMALS
jgi:hypothetical protein